MKQLNKFLLTLTALVGMSSFALGNTPGQHTVTLTWTETGCPTCTFNVYRSTTANACSGTPTPFVTGVATTNYTDATVTLGTTYFYDVTAVGTGGESACSNEAQIAVPSPPSAPASLQGTVN